MPNLDKTEKEMIILLQKDGRMSFVDMAKEIGVTEGTIRRKFNRLVNEGVVRVTAVADPFRLGFNAPVVFWLKVDCARFPEALTSLASLPELCSVRFCTGPYNVVAEANFSSNKELSGFIMDKLSRMPGVTEINTSLVLSTLKDSFEIGVPGYDPKDLPPSLPEAVGGE